MSGWMKLDGESVDEVRLSIHVMNDNKGVS